MKKSRFISKLKLYCVMGPIAGIALAPMSNVGEVKTEVHKTFEEEAMDFSNGINAVNLTEAIANYAIEEMQKEKSKENTSSGLNPYETDTSSITQEKVAELREKKEKEDIELLKRIMELSDAADEVESSKKTVNKESNEEQANTDDTTAYLNSEIYKENWKELNEETDKEKIALLKRIMELSDAANDMDSASMPANEIEVMTGSETDKEEVLNSFEKCKTLKDVEKRRKELESLNLTDDDKIYKDCKASAEMQHFIYEQSIANGYPFDFMLSIIDTETRGNFNAHNVEAYNKSSNSYDLGYAQQNSKWSLPVFAKKFKLKKDDAYTILKENDYANICAAFIEFEGIAANYKEFNAYEYAGCYNGWINWKSKPISRDYVYNNFMSTYDSKYTDYHKIEKEKNIKKQSKIKRK